MRHGIREPRIGGHGMLFARQRVVSLREAHASSSGERVVVFRCSCVQCEFGGIRDLRRQRRRRMLSELDRRRRCRPIASQRGAASDNSEQTSASLRRLLHRLPARSAMRRSSSGRKCLIRPWIGQAAASPSAQMVWPSTCLVTSSSLSIVATSASPSRSRSIIAPHPAGALAARGALAAALMLVEIADAADRADDVGRLVHDDDRRGAEARADRLAARRSPSARR